METSRTGAWIKLASGRFLTLSAPFATKIDVSATDARRIVDLDLFPEQETRRFLRHDAQVLAMGRPGVFVEPPDRAAPGAWYATLKIPVPGANGSERATVAFSHSLDLLEPLRELVGDRKRGEPPAPNGISDQLRASLDGAFQTQFRVPDLARALGCHPDHLARSFRESYGVTIAQHVAATRVAWVARRLAENSRPIAEIATDAGFYDQSHLTRVFRQILGMTPGQYRRSARALDDSLWRGPRRALKLASVLCG